MKYFPGRGFFHPKLFNLYFNKSNPIVKLSDLLSADVIIKVITDYKISILFTRRYPYAYNVANGNFVKLRIKILENCTLH